MEESESKEVAAVVWMAEFVRSLDIVDLVGVALWCGELACEETM